MSVAVETAVMLVGCCVFLYVSCVLLLQLLSYLLFAYVFGVAFFVLLLLCLLLFRCCFVLVLLLFCCCFVVAFCCVVVGGVADIVFCDVSMLSFGICRCC